MPLNSFKKELPMYEKFDWDDRLLTGIKDIDKDHIKLFSFINNLLQEAEGNKSHAVISVTISELIDYASSYFKREEAYMEEWGYPDFEQTQAQHISLTEEVIEIAENFEKNSENVDIEWFAEQAKRLNPDRTDLSSIIDYLDVDDHVSFGGAA